MSGQTGEEVDEPFDPRTSEILPEGTVLAGRYEILRHLAAGGMGRVYVAEQSPLGRRVALKIMHKELCLDDDSVKRFFREAVAVSQLTHPNTITIFDYGESSDGTFYIAMEYLEGEPLGERLKREGPLAPEDAIAITVQVARSLSEAHRKGIIHRDLKPENVFLGNVEKDLVKVLDFGIAKILQQEKNDGTKLTRMGFVCGTPEYMSPEQARGEDLDGRSDLYALGVLLYETLSGEPPFMETTPLATVLKHQNEDPPPLPPSIPEPMARFVLNRAMAKEAEDRPDEAITFIEELEVAAIQSGIMIDSTANLNADDLRRALKSGEERASSSGAPAIPDYGIATPPAMQATGAGRKLLVPMAALSAFLILGIVGVFAFGLFNEDSESGESTAKAATAETNDNTDGENTSSAGEASDPITIKITSLPKGAKVYENDVELGVTPLSFAAPEPGRRTFSFKMNGYAPGQESVNIPEPGEAPVTLSVDVELDKLVLVPVNSKPEGALVYVNDEAIGPTPIDVELIPKEPVSLSFVLDGYVPVSQEVYPDTGSTITVELVPEDGSSTAEADDTALDEADEDEARRDRRDKRDRKKRDREKRDKSEDEKRDKDKEDKKSGGDSGGEKPYEAFD